MTGAPVPGAEPPGWYDALLTALPGLTGGRIGALRPPVGRTPRHSAVLVLIGPGTEGPDVLLTQRAATLRSHAGQVAFPGGRIDPGDDGPVAAALREGREETGLDPAGVEVGAVAPELYVPVTNYAVHPVVAWWRRPSPVAPIDPAECVAVDRVPLADLTDPANRFLVRHPRGLVGPGFAARDLFVWGFTAAVLDRLLTLAGLERPWDTERVVALPPQPAAEEVAAAQAVPDPEGPA